MCGIVGYVGVKQAAPILLSGLSKLEYRGYDSAGLAVRDEANEHIEVVKAKGRLKNLMEMTDSGNAVHGLCGIGHTRWATHGEPSTVNAHPQYTREKRVVIVHNGIIENYQEIKESLLKKGYTFASQTDTEVAAALLDSYYAEAAKRESDPRARALDAIRNTMIRVRGSYALGILFGDQPGVIYAARKDSPLILGRCDGEYQGHMIASDVPAVLNYTRNVVYIDNQEIACLTRDELHVYNIDCEEIEKPFVEIKWDAAAAEKDGYEHFMMKEIHEQPRAVRDTLSPRIKENESGERYIDLSETGLTDEDFAAVSRVYLIGCGSAYHVGMAARYVLEKAARVPCEVDLASEFRYRDPVVGEKTLVVAISQSGETMDTIQAIRHAREQGAKVVAMSDSNGYIYDPNGIQLDVVKDIKLGHRGRIKEYAERVPGSEYHEGCKGVWTVPCDIALPCATQNEIDEESAKALVANGCTVVCEGANMPSTPEAIAVYQANNVLYGPAKAANAGGVAVSGLEMSQNSYRLSWTFEEVDGKLKSIMENIVANSLEAAKEYGHEGDLMLGANAAGFVKVANAMVAQGVL